MDTKSTHIERTKHIERQESIILSEIIKITQETPTVKSFLLKPQSSSSSSIINFDFLPGQWVDVFIPNIPITGGFTITSTPLYYKKTSLFELAIKYSSHPPSKWFHESSKIGDFVKVRIGGEFVWDDKKEKSTNNILFIAGGVGINPLMSMLQSIFEKNVKGIGGVDNDDGFVNRIQLLYSARRFNELLFYNRIENIRIQSSHILDCKCFLTREDGDLSSLSSSLSPPNRVDEITTENKTVYGQRIGKQIIRDVIDKEKKETNDDLNGFKCFICGPSQMEDDIISWLKETGVDDKKIISEKWW
nr:12969_t:CDS:2 [Entrophospora candida]